MTVAAPRLTTAPLAGVVLRVGLPAVASALLITAFNSIDAVWIGHQIGGAGLAAVSTSVFWIWMLVSTAEMVSVGLTAVAARRHGEGQPLLAAQAVGDALLFTLALGSVIAIVGTWLLSWLFAVMHTPPEVTALGRAYLGTYLLGTPAIFAFFVVDAAFRAAGDTGTPFRMLLLATVASVVLDPLLIIGWGPFPALGIRGAAIATLGVRGSIGVLGIWLLHRRGLVRVGRPRVRTLADICRVGLPTAATGVIFSLIYVKLTQTTSLFGTPAMAALGLGHRVESWMYMLGVGFGAAAAAIVGQNLGAGHPDRAMRAGWLTLGASCVPGVVAAAALLLVPEQLAMLFNREPAVVAEAVSYLRIAAMCQIVVSGETVLEGALGGAGWTLPPMLTSTALTVARVPLAAWAASHWGTTGIWWVINLTAMGRAFAMMALWGSGRWKGARV